MALTRTDLLGQISGASGNFGTGVFTTSSFTPPDNSLLVVSVAAIENGGTTSLLTDLTLASSAGLTFTNRVEQGASVTSFSTGVRTWTAPVSTGVSMTLDLDCAARSIGMYAVSVSAYTGYDTSTPIGATGSAFLDSGFPGPPTPASLTLNAAPATTSEVLGTAGMDKSTAGATPGAAFTEIHDVSNSDWGGLESEVRASSTSTTVDWVDLRPGGGALFNYAIVGLEVKAATGGAGPDPGVPPLVIQAPGLMVPNGLPVAWAGTEDTAAPGTQVVAMPAGSGAAGSATSTTGTATVTTRAGNAQGSTGTAAPTGTATITTSASVVFGAGGAATAAGAASQSTLPSGSESGSGSQALAGTATVSTTVGLAQGEAPVTTPTGAASVGAISAVALGAGGFTTATATTLQAGTPSGATGLPGTQAATGTTSVSPTAGSTVGQGITVSPTGSSSAATAASGALGAGVLTGATATTLQSAIPGRGGGGSGQSALSAAATVAGLPAKSAGCGLVASHTGAASTTASPGGCLTGGTTTTVGIAVFAVIGRAWALGGAQNIAVQLVSKGSMSPTLRQTAEMTPTNRGVPGMSPVDR